MEFWESAHKEGYYKNWSEVKEKRLYLEKAVNFIKKDRPRALDIGCSIGDYSIILAKKGFQVTGIDISETAIQISIKNAKKLNLPVDFRVEDARTFNKGKYDLILDLSCLTHLKKDFWNIYFQNIRNMLNPNGIYLISLWSKNSTRIFGIDPSKMNEKFYVREIPHLGSFYNYFFEDEEIKELFQKDYNILSLEEKRLDSLKTIQPKSDLRLFFIILQKRVQYH